MGEKGSWQTPPPMTSAQLLHPCLQMGLEALSQLRLFSAFSTSQVGGHYPSSLISDRLETSMMHRKDEAFIIRPQRLKSLEPRTCLTRGSTW